MHGLGVLLGVGCQNLSGRQSGCQSSNSKKNRRRKLLDLGFLSRRLGGCGVMLTGGIPALLQRHEFFIQFDSTQQHFSFLIHFLQPKCPPSWRRPPCGPLASPPPERGASPIRESGSTQFRCVAQVSPGRPGSTRTPGPGWRLASTWGGARRR